MAATTLSSCSARVFGCQLSWVQSNAKPAVVCGIDFVQLCLNAVQYNNVFDEYFKNGDAELVVSFLMISQEKRLDMSKEVL